MFGETIFTQEGARLKEKLKNYECNFFSTRKSRKCGKQKHFSQHQIFSPKHQTSEISLKHQI